MQWLRICAAKIAIVVFSFSLFGQSTASEQGIIKARNHLQKGVDFRNISDSLLNQCRNELADERDLRESLNELQAESSNKRLAGAKNLIKIFDSIIVLRSEKGNYKSQDTKRQVDAILSDPLFQSNNQPQRKNWVSSAFERMRDFFSGDTKKNKKVQEIPQVDPLPLQSLVEIVRVVCVALLIGAIIWIGILLYRQASWKSALARQARAMLDDDEPERSLDEWLSLADQLILEERYREAVRCLYVACLLKFDEMGVARFIRSETNWEHLHRIEHSEKFPRSIPFKQTTSYFDRVWYGMRIKGIEDVEYFRGIYISILDSAQEKKSA